MMKKYLLSLTILMSGILILEAQVRPLYSWSFDNIAEYKLPRNDSHEYDSIAGNYSLVDGIMGGKALRMDGFTTSAHIKPSELIQGSFTIEAWVSQAAYPWNWAPILAHTAPGMQSKLGTNGFYFGVGPKGELGMNIWIEGELYRCISPAFTLPLFTWNHVSVVFREGEGIYLFCNGNKAGFTGVYDTFTEPIRGEMILGMNNEAVKPSHIHRQHGTLPYKFSIDGAIDNLRVYNDALEKDELEFTRDLVLPENGSLVKRKMPSIPDRDKFGAYYTRLKYYREWDQLWPVADHPDVVVTFENSPVRFVFWRGSRYSPAWISENDFWMGDQSVEAWEHGAADAEGCFEHMQDRHCRYSHVRILENTPARVLVHWRYAPVSAHNSLWREDPKTGWACWVDEYYYIYPDGSAIRHVEWKKGSLEYPRQFQVSLGFTGPGQLRGDILEMDWLRVANQNGQQKDFVFRKNPDFSKDIWTPEQFNIQKHNFKSEYDPFVVFEEGNTMFGLRDKDMSDYSKPGKYNHWPVGQAYCDGRSCVASDRPAHFITFPVSEPVIHKNDSREWWNGLYGMTDNEIKYLVKLSKSWNNNPVFTRADNSELFYDKSQRAYIEDRLTIDALRYKVSSSKDNPLVNIALVITDWKYDDVDIIIDGKKLRNEYFSLGIVDNGDKQSMILWIEHSSEKELEFEITGR